MALVAAGTLAFGVLPATSAQAAHGTPFDLQAACEFAPESDLDRAGNAREDLIEDCLNNWDGPSGGAVLQGTNGSARFDATISRAQYAAVIVRIAAINGIDLPEIPEDRETFPDVPNGSFFWEIIEQAVELGLFEGKSDGTFDPAGSISGAQVVATAARLYRDTLGLTTDADDNNSSTDLDCGFANDDLQVLEDRSIVDDGATLLPDACSQDALRNFVFDVFAAILTYQTATGAIETPHQAPFSPFAVTADSDTEFFGEDGIEITVAVKDANGDPVEGVRVDLIATLTGAETDTNGALVPADNADFEGGDACTGSDCAEIDSTDPQTNAQGEVTLTLDDTTSTTAEQYTVFAFTGELEDTYVDDANADNSGTVDVEFLPGPDDLLVTSNTTPTGNLPYGSGHEVEVQIVDANGDPVALGGINLLVIQQRDGATVGTREVTTDADGAATLTYNGPADPNPGTAGDTSTDEFDAGADINEDGVFGAGDIGASTPLNVVFRDDAAGTVSVPDTFLGVNAQNTIDPDLLIQKVSSQATVFVDVVDLYGNPVSGEEVLFDSATFAINDPRTSAANGRASLTFAGPATSTCGTWDADVDLDGDDNFTDDVDTADSSENVIVCFYEVADTGDNSVTETLQYWLDSANEIALDSGFFYTYEATDQFNENGSAIAIGQFEEILGDLLAGDITGTITVTYDADGDDPSTFAYIG